MPPKTKDPDDFNYLCVCERCIDEECCADPYFTFCARNEIPAIQEFVKDLPKRYHNFLETNTINIGGQQYEYLGIRKLGGKCIFLKGRRRCLIHEVKPLQCRCWPLVWEWNAESNNLLIYIDEDPSCLLTTILKKNSEWLSRMKQFIADQVLKMTAEDRLAFSALPGDTSLRFLEYSSYFP